MTALTILLATFVAGCGGASPDGPAGGEGAAAPSAGAPAASACERCPDVILVTLDTTRVDHLGVYGRDVARTETLDAIARRGRVFKWAYSPLPLTIPAHSTLFTGLDVYHHGVRSNGDRPLGQEFDTLAEILKRSGYQTAASVAAFVTQRQWGLNQGFDDYFDRFEARSAGAKVNQWQIQRPANEVVDDALGWLNDRQGDEPYFLWVHLYDAHLPFSPPEPYSDQLEDPYDAELAFIDDQVQRIVDAVGDAPTLWVVAGDHGESRGEHLELDHGLFVYNATQHVPFFMAGPGVPEEEVEQPVGLVDVTPTVLHTLGLPVPPGLDGAPQPGNPHPLYLETWQLTDRLAIAPHIALVDGDTKLVNTPRPELYTMSEDPRERHDRAADDPQEVERMMALLAALEVPPPAGDNDETLDPATLSQLAALGYVAGYAGDYDKDLPDPKDREEVFRLLRDALLANLTRERDKEMDLLTRALEIEPRMREPRSRMLRFLAERGDTQGLMAQVDAAIAAGEDSPAFLQQAVVPLGELGEYEKVLELTALALAQDPENLRFKEVQVGTLMNMKRTDEAIATARSYLKDHPKAWPVYAAVGNSLAFEKHIAEAVPWLESAAEARRPRQDVRYYLGQLRFTQGKEDESLELIKAELKDYPNNLRAELLYARLLGRKARYEEQLAVLDRLAVAVPESLEVLHMRALALFNKGDRMGAMAAVQEGLARDPGHPGFKLMEANVLKSMGKLEEADAAFEEAKRLRALRPPAQALAP
jgi:choline-sulfatase